MDYKSRYYGEERGEFTRGRTGRLKCILISSTVFAVAACIALVLAIVTGYLPIFSSCENNEGCSEKSNKNLNIEPAAQDECKRVCTDPECMEAASQIVSYMDLTVDPCDDFYSFSCGNRGEDTFQLNNGQNILTLTTLSDYMTSKMQQTIETVNEEDVQSLSFKRKKLFDSCEKFARSGDTGVQDISRWLESIGLANWPHLDDHWLSSEEDFKRIMVAFLSIGVNPFMIIETYSSGRPEIFREWIEKMGGEFMSKTPNETVMIEIRMPYSCYPEHFEDYENFTLSYLPQFGVTADEANRVFTDALEVENIVHTKRFTLMQMGSRREELDCSSPEIAVNNRWCSILLQLMETSGASINMLSNSETTLSNAEYFAYMDNFLNEFDRRKIINYLCLRLVLEVMDSLRSFKKFEPPLQLLPIPDARYGCMAFQPLLYSSKKPCLAWLAENVPHILAADYIVQHDISSRAKKTVDLLNSIEDAFKEMVQNASIIEEEMRIQLMGMIETTLVDIKLYVDYFTVEFDAEEAFRQLQISDKFISNVFSVKRFKVTDSMRNPISEGEANTRLLNKFDIQADAGYIISVSLGLLQSPLLGTTRPRYLDFGHMGSILAHEFSHVLFRLLVHGIGRQAVQCLMEQYSRYKIPEVDVQSNGTITFDENFADNLGFLAAYRAYKKYVADSEEELSLPGVPFTNEQLFFIYLSQGFCEYGDRKGYERYIFDNHSPSQQRIFGTLRNIREFSEVFNCPIDSPMNPENKCEIKF